MGTSQSRARSAAQRWHRIRLLCAAIILVVVLMFLYGLSTGQIGYSQAQGALFKDPELGFANALIGCLALGGALYTLYLNQTQLDATLADLHESNCLVHYAELDRLYFDLLKLAVEHPYLRNPGDIKGSEQRSRYEAYAYMAWNFIETVIDRLDAQTAWSSADGPQGRNQANQDDLKLESTWQAAIIQEVEIHAAWLRTAGNIDKFKRGFDQALLRHLPPGACCKLFGHDHATAKVGIPEQSAAR